MDRKLANSLLVLLGVEDPKTVKSTRVEKKLKKRLTDLGIPADATPEQLALCKELGFEPTAGSEDSSGTVDSEDKSADKSKDASKDEAAATDDKTPRLYRLPGLPGQPDREENMEPELAAAKNKKREKTDDRRWVLVKPGEEKSATAKKGKKGSDKAADAPATKDKDKKKTGPKNGTRASGGVAAFKDAFKGRKTYDRNELIADLVKSAKLKDYSVKNYIALAKKDGDVFGFKLEEVTKGENKVLRKVEE